VPPNLLPESSDKDPRAGQQLRLASLAARFDEDRHQLYYDLLVRAIDADGTYNVALTGAYGTGKSSILDKLRKDRKGAVVELSLSTIAPEIHEAGGDAGGKAHAGAESRTNRIQKEIVKQLLYRLPPSKVPRSAFRRTSTPDRGREWGLAVLSGLATFGVVFGLGLVQPLVEGRSSDVWRQVVAYLLLAGVAVGGAWAVASLVRVRPTMSASVNTGPATVTLSKASETYFDEYLDEIVYFFQVSKSNVVVIEDIDRFGDVQVFDTLRALNGLLNSSGQVGQRIVFVYAIRDSVFEQIGVTEDGPRDGTKEPASNIDRAKATLERASRTKFFDVIIPVVPFVSADNARDVMSTAMKSDDFTINPALIRLAARHVADMRLIDNIRNEFEVYRNRLVLPDARVPGITNDMVFAIVLFKNTHLADFERIRHQDSTLDRLYSKWRELVRENLAAQTQRLAELRQARFLAQTASSRAAHFGQLLLELSETLGDAAQAASPQASVRLAGVATEDNVGDRETWAKIASGDAQLFAISAPASIYGYVQTVTHSLSFSASQLTKLLGAKVDPTEWEAADLSDVESKIAEVERKIGFLRHHTWAELCERADFTLPSPLPTADLSSTGGTPDGPPCFDAIVERVLESDLARDLVRHDFLTSHFALYSSRYYGEHLGPAAMEYISRCIEPGAPDPSFELDEEDVIQILREQGAADRNDADLFSDSSVQNISILDYLLKKRPEAAATVARTLSRWGEQERAFVDQYIAQSDLAGALLAAMSPTWQGVVRYAAVAAPVDSAARLGLLDAVLRALPNDEYEVDDGVRQFFETSYRDLNAVTHAGSAERAGIVLRVIEASGAVLESLAELDDAACDVAVDLRLYPVTEANLRTLSPADSIALDVLRGDGHDDRVYRYAVDRLADYLAAFETSPNTAHTVVDPNAFAVILKDAAKDPDTARLGRLIASASPGCRISTLAKAPSVAWPFLADGDRTDPTFENVKGYINEFGGIDEHLGALLANHLGLTETEGKPETDRLEVAVAILAAREAIPDVEVRVRLVASLDPGEVPATRMRPEPGTLIARLLGAGLLADDATAFTKELMVDWATYDAAIAASSNFATFVSPDLLDVSLVPDLLRSTVIPMEVKQAVVHELADYLAGASPRQAQALAKALNERGWRVHYARIEALRAAGAEAGELIRLVAREGEDLTIEDLKALLRAMGEPYSTVADGGRGRPTFDDDKAHHDVLSRLVGDTISRVEAAAFKGKGRQLVAPLLQPKA